LSCKEHCQYCKHKIGEKKTPQGAITQCNRKKKKKKKGEIDDLSNNMNGFQACVKDFSCNRIYSRKYIRTPFLPEYF